MNVKIRNAVPDDAAAIQKIIAAGYRRSFAGLHSTEYINERRDNVSETVFEFNLNRFI